MNGLSPNALRSITPYVVSDPYGIDIPSKAIQSAMSGISWIEKSFARAVIQSRKQDGASYTFPSMFVADGKDFLDMIALDVWKSYSFLIARDPETPIDYNEGESNRYERRLDLIVWMNLQRVDNTRKDDFLPELIEDVKTAIRTAQNAQFELESIEILNIYDEPQRVFEGFTVDLDNYQNLYYPYRGFRIEMNTIYSDVC